jgi:hypothetical protein
LKNSGDSPRFNHRIGIARAGAVCGLLCAVVSLAALWCFQHGCILYYGDAQSHLNLSRSILDSRTPGYDQLGNVWLPVLHVLCLPFVRNDSLWNTGLAGTIPVAACFVLAGMCFYFAAWHAYESSLAAAVVSACFALNPNVLYLASIPMTEIVFLAGLALLLLALLRFRAMEKTRFLWLGIAASCAMSLTRYEGWFFIPFAGMAFALLARRRWWVVLIGFGVITSLAPLYWLAHNWWETGNALDFYNGPYSAKAIQASKPYPGYHDWALAIRYYGKACQLCAGWPLSLLGVVGVFCAAIKRVLAPILFLLLTPIFYIWSMYSSGSTPIFVPQLWPFSYYNTRYGIAMLPVAAFAAGAIVLALPAKLKRFSFVIPLLPAAMWLAQPSPQNWICWKESEVNSVARRAWTAAGADFFRDHYQDGQGILVPTASGDVSGIFCAARIPLAESLHVGNGPAWYAATLRPDLFHRDLWAIAQQGDIISAAMNRTLDIPYRVASEIEIKTAPAIKIYRRSIKTVQMAH